jgi:hypothetical protein
MNSTTVQGGFDPSKINFYELECFILKKKLASQELKAARVWLRAIHHA